MKARIYIIALLSVVAVLANAQDWNRSINDPAIQSHQIMQTGTRYQGTVYEPFDNTLPSEQSSVGGEESGQQRNNKNGIRRGLIGGPEDDLGPSPVGDAILPMLLLLGAYCGFLYVRRKRSDVATRC